MKKLALLLSLLLLPLEAQAQPFSAQVQQAIRFLKLTNTLDAGAPTCNASSAGRTYFSLTSNGPYYCNGTAWTVWGAFSGGTVSGATIFQAKVTFSDGSATTPSWGWTSDDDGSGTGAYRSAANTIGFACNGVLCGSISNGGWQTTNNNNVLFSLHSVETVATTKTPNIQESSEIYTNGADVDGQTITLPDNPTAGVCYLFALTSTDTSNSFAIAPSAGETLFDGASQCATNITATAKGATLEVCAASGGSGAVWVVYAKDGTWTCS